MAAVLRSHVLGAWHTPSDEGRPLFDAVTGAEVARLSSAGVDFAAALEYGRRVGGPALRELTFHQRAALLKALAGHLREHREELYAVSARTGATLCDSRFDVDGGIGVLLAYASKGRRELPNDTVLRRGRRSSRSARAARSSASTSATPLHGVAVQINAFNFPVWGPLEKLAPAFLAGVPPSSSRRRPTAYLTARLVRLIVESGLLPEGAVQLVAGALGDLLDHLTGRTSSRSPARRRPRPRCARTPRRPRGVRFTAEADSLNCSVLGPDAAPGTPEFDLYVEQLVTEMTVKAGQKCTAIRRAFVPGEHVDAVVEAVSARLGEDRGRRPGRRPRMGALAGLEQREEVRRGDQGAGRRRPDRLRRPGEGRPGRRRRRARRVRLPDPAGRRPGARPSRTRSRRSGRCRR